MNSVVVRPATPEDAPAAVALVRRSISELCAADHQHDPATLERWLGNKSVAFFLRWLADPSTSLVVAELEQALCGVGSLRKGGQLTMIYVLPGRQGVGVGSAILRELEAQAARWHEREISLTSSFGARAFYERHGYVSAGEAKCKFGVLTEYPYHRVLVP